ncbi:two-component system, chemotaxis family, CheB/CheR fusion protein [Geoalkalibacter ferrihydriticus]|uniref:protein-glutamate O-methyltransferase n=2 Tax=Geoalkalibacter ferrihydriticus TaxID=392333 RepID=A0A0C2HIU5_9BACT|nr:chemotaxis protein CheB [Geoalkalibacter ferrihydriticus]KIH76986.1 chemotaxis protein CheB [Geoalkalibacter ferrihydriticus DSM 17813]SDL40763.1 two-component system, chemotaxis family, CheB/CheR fusion protein [Geoalkalibacter ferrihydriticus]
MKNQPKPDRPDQVSEKTAPRAESSTQDDPRFAIVGIGASAGGLEALEKFLRQVPQNSGLAFVIIQHLDPTHKCMMPELLQRETAMKVFEVRDRMRVKPNCVYVIPPNKDMSILHGVLHLFEPTTARGLRLPIDFFLRSLAEDLQEGSIGVILSGMGSDGTLGLKAIKEKAGVVLVQEPASAKFDSMPRSAIAAGLADLVAPAEELPAKILEYLHLDQVLARSETPLEEKDQSALEKVVILLRTKTGQDFSLYKKSTVYRRIERRMIIHQISKIADYVRYLEKNPQEVKLLFKELLIGVTNFFRDPPAWELLQSKAIPALLKEHPAGGTLRAWSVGCSSGEEAYSLAIAFTEAIEQLKPEADYTLQIFATDLDQDAIDKARLGYYPNNIAADLSDERLRRFFIQEENGYRIGKKIRAMVTFATQNVIMDPPFTKLDILTCRNLLIYLMPELQKKILPLFHYSLKPGGLLFLGNAETVSACPELFTPLNLKFRLFQRRESVLPLGQIYFPASSVPSAPENAKESTKVKPASNLQALADELLLQHFSPPAVLVNNKGDILYISGRTGKYLEPAAGKANWNIFAMAREGLRFELGISFHKVLRQKEAIILKNIKVGTNGGSQTLDVTLKTIEEPEALQGMVMIVFHDVPEPPSKKLRGRAAGPAAANARVVELEQETQKLREELHTTREEMHSSQEELKSTNEELQSTNEELQSTNEELTTSKEEMQSMNEELQTVNAEQQSKMDELTRTEDDLRNLLNSTEIITVFLDKELHVRRFTEGAKKIFKLLPGDVGRPLSDITSDLLYSEMSEDAQEVLRSLSVSEKQIETTDGRWFLVRIMPYRTMDDVIGGVVITYTNITEAKTTEKKLREEIEQLKHRLEGGS